MSKRATVVRVKAASIESIKCRDYLIDTKLQVVERYAWLGLLFISISVTFECHDTHVYR